MPRLPPDLEAGPRRTCVGCRAVRPQVELIRVVRRRDATLAVGRRLPGRGAWLCRDSPQCLDRAAREGGFARSFRAAVPATSLEGLRTTLGDERDPG